MFPLASASKSASGVPRSGSSTLQDRAPGLKDGVDRLITALVKGLQTMAGTTTTIEGAMAGAGLEPLRDVVATHPADGVAGLIECADIGCKLMVTLNGRLVHSVVELLAGGNGAEPAPTTPRPATPIDHQFSLIVVTLAAGAIKSEWADLGFGQVRAAKIEGPLTPDLIGTRTSEVAVVRLTLGLFGEHGTLRLVLPEAALERFRAGGLAEAALAEDPDWRDLLQKELGRASVSLGAYLDAKPVALSSLAALQVGQILALPLDARARVSLVCDGRVFYRGELGQDEGRYSLRVEDIVTETEPPVARDLGTSRHSLPVLPRA